MLFVYELPKINAQFPGRVCSSAYSLSETSDPIAIIFWISF